MAACSAVWLGYALVPLEQHVLVEVEEPRRLRSLADGAGAEGDLDPREGHSVVLQDEDLQPVVERVTSAGP